MENTGSKVKDVSIIVLVLAVLVMGGYLISSKTGGAEKMAKVEPAKVASVATVNGTAILKDVFDTQLAAAVTAYKAQGVDVTDATKLATIKTEVLTNLTNNELVNQAIVAAGIKATPEEVEKQFQALLTQAGGADKMKEELAKSNLTEAQLRENIAKQIATQTYLLQNIDTKSITVTDAEIAAFYADYSKAQTTAGAKTIPAQKDISVQIKQQITLNKQQALVKTFVDSLRAKAKIETTI